MTGVLPYTTLAIAAVMPLAAGIYLLTTTAWTLAERAVLARRIAPPGAPTREADARGGSRSA